MVLEAKIAVHGEDRCTDRWSPPHVLTDERTFDRV
jgi:hypothetical protein